MKSQILKKEEEVEKLEEEVVRSKIVKLKKNIEETETSTSVTKNEEKYSRLLEKKNEENRKSYAEVLKGRNHGQPKSMKTIEDTYSRRPSVFKPLHIIFIIPMTINDVNLSVTFIGVSGLSS
jgi:hypothetical protein